MKSTRQLRSLVSRSILTLAAAIFLALLVGLGFFERAEHITQDIRFELREWLDSDHHFDPRIQVIGVDEPDLKVLGRWPWNREYHGEMVSLLTAAGADAIAFDLLFVEPGNDPDADSHFAAAVAETDNVIVGAEFILRKGMESSPPPPAIKNVVNAPDIEPSDDEVILLPYPELAAAAQSGFVNADADSDGGRRELPLVQRYKENYYPSLATQTLMTYWGIGAEDLEVHFGDQLIFNTPEGKRSAPIDNEGKMVVNLRSPERFREESVFSYVAIFRALTDHLIDDKPWDEKEYGPHPTGRIYVVGQVAAGLSDMGPTAFEPLTPLCFLQAQAMSNILQGDFIHIPARWICFLIWTPIVIGLLVSSRSTTLWKTVLIPPVAICIFLTIAALLFAFQGILIPIVWPVFGYVTLQAGTVVRSWQRDHDAKVATDASLRAAGEIQLATLPSAEEFNATHPEVDLAAILVPAQEASGDFYDFFEIDEDHLCFVIADVCDKGITAATFMLQAKTLLKSEAKASVHLKPNDQTPAAIFQRANDELASRNTKSMFATVFLGIYEISSGKLSYGTAGHYPPIHFSEKTAPKSLPTKQDLALGLIEGVPYHTSEVILRNGETIFLYTDGITEAFNEAGAMFGEDRLIRTLDQNCKTPSQPVADQIKATIAQLKQFTAAAEQSDDITAILIRRN